MTETRWLPICASADLRDGGPGARFVARIGSDLASCFVVRHGGTLRAYLNRCSHVAMELDWQPGQFFDSEGEWLMCATHGALFDPANGRCAGGPCSGRGGLRAVRVQERDGTVCWLPDDYVQAAPDQA